MHLNKLFTYLDSLHAASAEKLLQDSLHNIRTSETMKIQIKETNSIKST